MNSPTTTLFPLCAGKGRRCARQEVKPLACREVLPSRTAPPNQAAARPRLSRSAQRLWGLEVAGSDVQRSLGDPPREQQDANLEDLARHEAAAADQHVDVRHRKPPQVALGADHALQDPSRTSRSANPQSHRLLRTPRMIQSWDQRVLARPGGSNARDPKPCRLLLAAPATSACPSSSPEKSGGSPAAPRLAKACRSLTNSNT
mmetsp:Transcript_83450/g.200232  ORF Transcript_83450/g.200232 Transcript_83450/m.200232 type:complete len:203 (+) Transcript_83450:275-883(+)